MNFETSGCVINDFLSGYLFESWKFMQAILKKQLISINSLATDSAPVTIHLTLMD